MEWYYYLHTNGDLIGKNPVVVTSDYFDSSFIKKFWRIDTKNREDAWTLVLEALALGANIKRIRELSNKWKLTFNDSINLLQYSKPTSLMKEGLEIFIIKILNMSIDDYWDKVEKIIDKKIND